MQHPQNALRGEAILLHQQLLEDLSRIFCEGCKDIEKLLTTAVFAVEGYVERLYELVPQEGFTDPDEEIFFFKTIKPLFTVEREYHQRLYHAAIFDRCHDQFCDGEIRRMDKLLTEYKEFSEYYHSGCTEKDYPWFCQGQAPIPTSLCMQPWETNPRYTSAKDSWVAGLLAVERYRDWLQASQLAEKTRDL